MWWRWRSLILRCLRLLTWTMSAKQLPPPRVRKRGRDHARECILFTKGKPIPILFCVKIDPIVQYIFFRIELLLKVVTSNTASKLSFYKYEVYFVYLRSNFSFCKDGYNLMGHISSVHLTSILWLPSLSLNLLVDWFGKFLFFSFTFWDGFVIIHNFSSMKPSYQVFVPGFWFYVSYLAFDSWQY